ncbi:helix-turn-helix domain-containing protein [Enterococcus raffinosus]|uniref:helix-turn-helix domain-containing protein n=1 Tax=Enterococcus raffinosus TaxID=71452 RepID=UPI0004284E86|nr:helix-turn-helix transcriptional regulator [Enterococcus raffinosus]MBS6430047.1 helix-turn-helix transcriptional regulator [Enterococcus raffinosus]UXJ97639.1 helix-turn-helix domain-containing protein [Enterococcus raffinosus]
MNLSKQIKKLREEAGYSQEELSEKIYVSRQTISSQTISNWENERSYPDIHNLLLLSVLFNVTLDELVKGDVETMKKVINKDEMNKYSYIMGGTILAAAISFGPVWKIFGDKGLWIPFILWLIGMWAAIKIEKIKKEKNVKTYKEIVAYMESGDVEEKRQERSFGKDLATKILIVVTFTAIVSAIVLLSLWISGMF